METHALEVQVLFLEILSLWKHRYTSAGCSGVAGTAGFQRRAA